MRLNQAHPTRRVNDNTAGRPRSGHASAAHPGFGGGLFVGVRNASVLVSGSDLGGNCAWLGAAVVSLVHRSLDTQQLEATAGAAVGMAELLGGGTGGGGDVSSSSSSSSGDTNVTGAASGAAGGLQQSAGSSSSVTELIAQADALMHSVAYAQQQSTSGNGDGGSTAASNNAGSSFMFVSNSSLQQPANPNNCSSFWTAQDLLPAQRLVSHGGGCVG